MGSPASCRASLFRGDADDTLRSNAAVAGAPMVSATGFGRKMGIRWAAQIKHQLLMMWLKDQTEKEAAETAPVAGSPAPHVHEAAR